MAVLFASTTDDPAPWREALALHVDDLDFRVWPEEAGDSEDIEFALVWDHAPGSLRGFPNLRAIFSLGAGVEHIFRDPDLPDGVPVVRLVDTRLAQDMTEYVLSWVLYYHRDLFQYRRHQEKAEWRKVRPTAIGERTVGILGLGEMGGAAARALAGLGFRVKGWSRTAKDLDGIECFHGAGGLAPFLADTQILVCLLPLTDVTRGIIDRELLAALPKGAFVINAARGGHVVNDDLVAALDSGHVAAATLDVFEVEPLPDDHVFWRHPAVTVTPHAASITNVATAAAEIAEDMRRLIGGGTARHVVDPAAGY